MSASMNITDAEIIAASKEYGGQSATYVIANRLRYKHKGLKTAYVLRRLKKLESAGLMQRMPTSYVTQIVWSTKPQPSQHNESE